MKKKTKKLFELYKNTLSQDDVLKLDEFFKQFNMHCLIAKSEKHKMVEDFENAILTLGSYFGNFSRKRLRLCVGVSRIYAYTRTHALII